VEKSGDKFLLLSFLGVLHPQVAFGCICLLFS
jgi:hypothetical protein